jgi:hypoxanthine phosphoribosyltransferase
MARKRKRRKAPAPAELKSPDGRVVFAHVAEAEFARLLDFYQIKWEYEPRSFPLRWDEHGRPTQSFTPDFYLPEFDLYVELTTLRQRLVSRKNQKLRRLRELYPWVNIRLLYARDVRNLFLKYGIAGLLGSPSANGSGPAPEKPSEN